MVRYSDNKSKQLQRSADVQRAALNARKLGKIQKGVLKGLFDHGSWYPGCRWIWDTTSNTQTILDSLVRRGLAERVDNTYTITEAGKIKLADLPRG